MTKKIEIPVEARLNTAPLEQSAKKVDEALGRVGKRKIDPVPDSAIRKIDALFQAYLKLDREMARRLKESNQSGIGPDQINFDRAYPNATSRQKARKLQQMQDFFAQGGEGFHHPGFGGGGGGGGSGGGWRQAAAGVAQAGMRAAGPVGGVAAKAMGTGMSAGFGAGLMGLVGGMAALGVGKLVSAAAEKIDQAENNNIAYDRLKRTLGDVNVSFIGLKKAVTTSGDALNLKYDETESLFSQFSKAGKVSGKGGYQSLPQEIGLGVGLSRAYGLDPSQGVGFMGQMRGVGVTKDAQDSRRLALLIGETIAKSDAFSKADEVMEAIAGFATAQTRQSLAAANVSGYAGMFSSMVGSGIAGMDPTNAAAILSKVNSNLAAGGGHGEASQFFTSMVANRMGLDPLQMQVLREGGAFATKDQMFDKDKSAYGAYMGRGGPTGSNTLLSETRALMEEKYGGESEQQKLMKAKAFANHATGGNMNQAMVLLSLTPKKMGELEKVLDGKALSTNASGISNAAMALNGTNEQRAGIRDSLLKRGDLKSEDRKTLEGLGGMSQEDQKRTLAVLSAQYEQERTQGQEIRDSRAALDNLKVSAADMVTIQQDMRKALLYMAGDKGKKTPAEIMKEIAAGEEEDRVNGVKSTYESKVEGFNQERAKILDKQRQLKRDVSSGKITPEEYAAQMRDLNAQSDQIGDAHEKAKAERDAAMKPQTPTPAPGGSPGAGGGAGAAASSASVDDKKPAANVKAFVEKYGPLAEKIAKEKNVPVDAVLGQWGLETGWGKSIIPGTNNLGNIKDFSGAGPKAKDNMTGSVDSYRAYDTPDAFGEDFKKLLDKKRFAGAKGTDNARDYFSALKKGGYAEDPNYVNSGVAAAAMAARARSVTPMPEGAKPSEAGGGRGMSVSFEPLIVKYPGKDGRQIMPDQAINTIVNPASPYGRSATGAS